MRLLPAAGRLESADCPARRAIPRLAGRAAISGGDARPGGAAGFLRVPVVPGGMEASGSRMTLPDGIAPGVVKLQESLQQSWGIYLALSRSC